jgi:transposase
MRNKTDRNDARGLAQILRTGWYSRVHVKSLQSHQVRALLASRKAILKKCVDLENELRGPAQGIRDPPAQSGRTRIVRCRAARDGVER